MCMGVAKVSALAVDPAYRRIGLGAALVTLATHTAHHSGAVIVYGQARTTVPGLAQWYARLGFQVLPEGTGLDLTLLLDRPAGIKVGPHEQIFLSEHHRPARARF
jgi:GNAT superfamily N-acetyltransferase